MNSRDIISGYLADIGATPAPLEAGGKPPQALKASKEKHSQLLRDLAGVQERSRRSANLVLMAHVAVLALVAIAAWYNISNPKFLLAIFATGTGILVALLASFRAFWRDTVDAELLCAVLPGLTVDEALKILLAFYSRPLGGSKAARRRATP